MEWLLLLLVLSIGAIVVFVNLTNLGDRITALDNTLAGLERRVRSLEGPAPVSSAASAAAAAPVAPAPAWTPPPASAEIPVAPLKPVTPDRKPASAPAFVAATPESVFKLSWEQRIGGQLLNWIGAVTLLIAVGFGLKLAYQAGYITWIFHLSPWVYLALGWTAGIALLVGGEWQRHRVPLYAQALSGVGVATLYLTTYSGHALYHVISSGSAMFGLALCGAVAITRAVRHNAIAIGWLGVLLAYASPVLVGGGGPSPGPLFIYLTALNIAVLGISMARSWPGFRLAAFLASAALFGAWYAQHYTPIWLWHAVYFVAGTWVIFQAVLLAAPVLRNEKTSDSDLGLAVLAPALCSLTLYSLLQHRLTDWHGAIALFAAAVYWVSARAIRLRRKEEEFLEQIFFAAALAFAVLAIPLQFHGRVMAAAWSLMGAGLSVVGYRTASVRTRRWGLAALVLAAGRLLLIDVWTPLPPGSAQIFNARGFSFGMVELGLGILGAVLVNEWRRTDRRDTLLAGYLGGVTLAVGGLMQLWMRLDLPLQWVLAGWCAVAGVSIGFGGFLRSREVRAVGVFFGMLPLWAVFGGTGMEEVVHQQPLWPIGGWLGALALYTGAAWHFRLLRTDTKESEALTTAAAAAAAMVAMRWTWLTLDPGWVTAAWAAVTVLILVAGVRGQSASLRILALVSAAVVAAEVLLHELTPAHVVFFNPRSCALLSAMVAWAACAWAVRRATGEERKLLPGTLLCLNGLGLLWSSLEAMDAASNLRGGLLADHASQFALSAVWVIYGAASIAVGFRRDVPAARWGGLGLLLAAIAKVYLFDLAHLELGYRVLSFLVLAAVLMAVSYGYQRQAHSPLAPDPQPATE